MFYKLLNSLLCFFFTRAKLTPFHFLCQMRDQEENDLLSIILSLLFSSTALIAGRQYRLQMCLLQLLVELDL